MNNKKKKKTAGKRVPASTRIWEVEEVPMEYIPPPAEKEEKLGDLLRKLQK